MNKYDENTLANYNAEVYRGIVHTKEWDENMAKLQEEFDTQYCQLCRRTESKFIVTSPHGKPFRLCSVCKKIAMRQTPEATFEEITK